jgi:UDP-N-acetylmuramyl pentapeptide phosphotransferase/UDP-N-acetylglucosamine-1-phosphate transferase
MTMGSIHLRPLGFVWLTFLLPATQNQMATAQFRIKDSPRHRKKPATPSMGGRLADGQQG